MLLLKVFRVVNNRQGNNLYNTTMIHKPLEIIKFNKLIHLVGCGIE